jgi:hypothetical protein
MAELERCRLQQLLTILLPSAARIVGDNVKPLEERLQSKHTLASARDATIWRRREATRRRSIKVRPDRKI